ncbi:MAG: PQQ-binding-like beta-propeller repeat protein [Planctomycetia bacterium]|nr:PQQ-binding-like beta-propeller repeat protein [Planctomycetia bacterium]
MKKFACFLLGLWTLVFACGWVQGADWPCWRGANRDGISRDTGLMRSWPEQGPPLIWKNSKVGQTANGMAVLGNRVYTIGSKGGAECVFCIDNETGKTVWARPIGKGHARSYYPMVRSTPTVYKNKIYVLSTSGSLVCMDSGSGATYWFRTMASMGGVMPPGGYAESPYVDGKWVIVCPGGPGCTMVAMDRHWGPNMPLVWVSKAGMGAGYSSIIKASFGREHQYVNFTGDGLVGAKVRGGDVRWRYEAPAHESGLSAVPPIWFAQTVLAAGANGTGVVWLQKEGQAYKATEVWFNEELKIPTGDILKINDYVFGVVDGMGLVCFQYKTGKVVWSDASLFPTEEDSEAAPGKKSSKKKKSTKVSSVTTDRPDYLAQKTSPVQTRKLKKRPKPPVVPQMMASMSYAEGMLYIRTSAGELALVDASPKGFHLRGKIALPQMKKGLGVTPVVANGFLYLREGDTIFCFDIRSGAGSDPAAKEAPSGPRKPLPGMPANPEVKPRGVPKMG